MYVDTCLRHYVGHGRRCRDKNGPAGASLANAYPIHGLRYVGRDADDNDLRAEVCGLCAQTAQAEPGTPASGTSAARPRAGFTN